MDFAALIFGTVNTTVIYTIENTIRSQATGKAITYGYHYVRNRWTPTDATRKNYRMTCALEHFATNVAQCRGVFAVIAGRGVKRLAENTVASNTMVIWWQSNIEHHEKLETTDGASVRLSELVGE